MSKQVKLLEGTFKYNKDYLLPLDVQIISAGYDDKGHYLFADIVICSSGLICRVFEPVFDFYNEVNYLNL